MSFFGVGGNPFATQVGSKIEKATQESLPTENWGLYLEICDIINNSEEGPRDAMKAIRKRLSTNPKSYNIVMYTLTVLETCVKNCGRRFHILACSKDFVQDMVKLIGPKNDPPLAVQDKVLSLIQSWSEAFKHQPDLSGVSQVYADLKQKGIEFPPPSPESSVPLVSLYRPSSSASSHLSSHPSAESYRRESDTVDQSSGGSPVSLTEEQKSKLASELSIVESNTKVLTEMLNELTPGKEEPDDLQLLKDLFMTCRSMQKRMVDLVGSIDDDLLIADILRINDDLNNVFVRYDRHMGKHRGASGETGSHKRFNPQATPTDSRIDAPLIDLGDGAQPTQQMAALNIGKKVEEADFDSFAQSRTGASNGDGAKSLNNAKTADPVPKDQRLSDFDEMEKWLEGNSGSKGEKSEALSSSEFDKFLAERAAVADSLPTISAATGSMSASSVQRENTRSIEKDPKNDDKEMFSL